MPEFEYHAETSAGQRSSGKLNADDIDQARQTLTNRGLSVIELRLSDTPASGGRLSSSQAEALVAQVANLSSAEAPLAEGLRAAAAESATSKVAIALRTIAARLDQGQPLEKILAEESQLLPAHVRGLVNAATRTGRLGLALEELVEHQRSAREIWWGVMASIAYPLLVLGLTFGLLALFPLYIVPPFKTMFEEFDLELPTTTHLLIHFSDSVLWLVSAGRWLLLVGCGLLLVGLFLSATGWGGGAAHRFLATAPVVGPLWYWSGTAAGTHLLATLLDHGVPLPEALRLAASGVRNGGIREAFLWLADGVADGSRLSVLLVDSTRLPASLVPLVRWGEKTGELAEALRDASEMFTARIRLRAQMLRSILPVMVFLFVLLVAGSTILALFLPLVSLIQGLS